MCPQPVKFPLLEYLTSAHRLNQLPPERGPEIAIAGRSNAGKSSALNVIAGQRSLARTSKTPGRTQQLNVFEAEDGRRIIDLPGYGYAKVPERLRAHWGETISAYLHRRQALIGLLIVMDARHPLKAQDEQLISWCSEAELPIHVLLTKSDKLKRGAATLCLRQTGQALAEMHGHAAVQLFSSVTGTGLQEARSVILDWWRGGEKRAPAN